MKELYAAALALSFSWSVDAATTWMRCDYCAPAQAEAMVISGPAPATRGVYNLAQNWASKFEIHYEQVGPGCVINGGSSPTGKDDTTKITGTCEYRNVAYSVPLESDESTFFAELFEFYIATGGGLKETINVDAAELGLPYCPDTECVNAGTTAYDVARNFGVAQRLREYTRSALEARRQLGLRLFDWLVARTEVAVHGLDANTRVVVRFSGGSTAVIEFTVETPHGVITGTFDPNGNPVWETAADAREGEGEFEHSFSVSDFLQHARRLGISITDSGSASRIFTCENDGRNGVRCRRGG